MCSRALRYVFNVSTKLKELKDLNKFAFVSSSFILTRQQILVHRKFHSSTQHLADKNTDSKSPFYIPKDSKERKDKYIQDAQAQIDEMIAKNPEVEKFIKIVEMEIEVMRQNGYPVPSNITAVHWLDILKTKSQNRREKYYEFLFSVEKKNENRKKRQEEKSILFEKYKEERDGAGVRTDKMVYGIGRNSFFRRINDKAMNQLWNWNSLKALMWGNKIVFDFSYEQYMKPQEIRSCAKQIMESYALNRQHNFPYHVYLCNVNMKGALIGSLIKFIPSMFDNDFPWTVTEKSFVDIFEKDSLVYLTSHGREILRTYNPDSVYIIGAFVDKTYKQPVSLANAKRLDIRAVKLPLDEYLHFGNGSHKNLTLNQVMGIMLDVQGYGWEKAMDHIPKRKLFEFRVSAMERKLKKDMERAGLSNEVFTSRPAIDFRNNSRIKTREMFEFENCQGSVLKNRK